MKKIILITAALLSMSYSTAYSQGAFNAVWLNAGFGLSLPEMYTVDATGDEHWDGLQGSKSGEGVFGLLVGMGINMYEFKKGTYFCPSVYYQYLTPGDHLIYYYDYFDDDNINYYDYRFKNTIRDFSFNGDFYFQIPKRERTLYLGFGVGIHNVTFKQEFSGTHTIDDMDIDVWDVMDEIPGLPGLNANKNLIDESETKIGLNLLAKVKLVNNLFLEGRFELIPGMPQFRISASFPIWKKEMF